MGNRRQTAAEKKAAEKKAAEQKAQAAEVKVEETTPEAKEAPEEIVEVKETDTAGAGEGDDSDSNNAPEVPEGDGEVTGTEPAPEPEPAKETIDIDVVAKDVVVAKDDFVDMSTREELSTSLKFMDGQLNEYVTQMAPKRPIEAQDMLSQQRSMISVIDSLLRLRDEEFANGMNLILSYVAKYRNAAFSEMYVFRGLDRIKMASQKRNLYTNMINLLVVTVDVKDRKDVVKQVSMPLIYDLLSNNGDAQQLLESYYS